MVDKRVKQCRLVRLEIAASLPEYALLLALIAVICLGAMAALGSSISSVCANLGASL
jgi:Flp pilus assembly pilin Flp